MKRAFLLGLALSMLAGSWHVSLAQASKPATSKKTATAHHVEPPAPTETAAVQVTVADTTQPSDSAPADSTPHKKKGLFGKAKSVMSNKIVKTVAKTAACTMIPGGQMIAGAIDAAGSESAGEAASGAASAATGTSCMPGMGGMGAGGAGMAGAGLAGGMMPQMAPTSGAYPEGMPAGAYGMGTDSKPMAECMGLTVDEFNAMTNPTNGEPRQPTKAEMKRASQLNKKVGAQRSMACQQQVGMQQQNAQMAQMQQMMAMAQARGGMGNMAVPATNGGDASMTEAPGEQVVLSNDLAAELKKGKTVVRGIDWVAGSGEISPAGRAAFESAMTNLGQAIKATGQRYRLDLYVDQKYDDAAVGMFAASRIQTIQAALGTAIGDPAALPAAGKTKRDKNPRLEVVKTK